MLLVPLGVRSSAATVLRRTNDRSAQRRLLDGASRPPGPAPGPEGSRPFPIRPQTARAGQACRPSQTARPAPKYRAVKIDRMDQFDIIERHAGQTKAKAARRRRPDRMFAPSAADRRSTWRLPRRVPRPRIARQWWPASTTSRQTGAGYRAGGSAPTRPIRWRRVPPDSARLARANRAANGTGALHRSVGRHQIGTADVRFQEWQFRRCRGTSDAENPRGDGQRSAGDREVGQARARRAQINSGPQHAAGQRPHVSVELPGAGAVMNPRGKQKNPAAHARRDGGAGTEKRPIGVAQRMMKIRQITRLARIGSPDLGRLPLLPVILATYSVLSIVRQKYFRRFSGVGGQQPGAALPGATRGL